MSIQLTEIVRRTIQKHHLIPRGSKVVVGVSGGADSLALLHILHSLRSSLRIELQAATFDHRLRGNESAADAHFVEQTCEAWGIPVTVGSAPVKALAREQHIGIETAARKARYAFLAEVARQTVTTCIAVAHHADDQAETLLLHMLRGSGVHGLRGMSLQSPVPDFPDLILIRPLLIITRAEIETYCRENGLTPRQDSSNEDTHILRNYLRHETLPHLARMNPQIQRGLARLAETMGVEDDYLNAELQSIIPDVISISAQGVRLRREPFRSLHPALQRRLLIWAAGQVGEADDVDYEHIVDAVEIGLKGKQGAIAQLKRGLRLRVDYGALVVEREDTPAGEIHSPQIATSAEIPVVIPGTTELGGWQLHTTFSPQETTGQSCSLAVPEGSSVVLRTRRKGDRFEPLGLGGHSQKVNRWMMNQHVPRMVRNSLPLLIIDNAVAAIWFEGKWAVSERFRFQNGTRVVYFELRQHS